MIILVPSTCLSRNFKVNKTYAERNPDNKVFLSTYAVLHLLSV
jgi:hypothetical protein